MKKGSGKGYVRFQVWITKEQSKFLTNAVSGSEKVRQALKKVFGV